MSVSCCSVFMGKRDILLAEVNKLFPHDYTFAPMPTRSVRVCVHGLTLDAYFVRRSISGRSWGIRSWMPSASAISRFKRGLILAAVEGETAP